MTRFRFVQSPLRALERRLVRARPSPTPEFTRRSGRVLGTRWAARERPAALRVQVLGLIVVGALLLVIALVIAVS